MHFLWWETWHPVPQKCHCTVATLFKTNPCTLHEMKSVLQVEIEPTFNSIAPAGWPVGFYRISTTKKNSEYRPNIDHTALYRPNIDHKSSLKSAYLHVLRHNPTSQEIHVKQGAGRYFHISSFNGRVIHFQVLRFIIFQIIGKIYHHSERF